MKEVFIKRYWEENETLFYLHFQNDQAVRQIEISRGHRKKLSLNHPVEGDSMLFDQDLKELEADEKDFISKQEFETAWE